MNRWRQQLYKLNEHLSLPTYSGYSAYTSVSDVLDNRRLFAEAQTKYTPFTQSILKILTAYLIGSGVIVKPANEKVTVRRIENVIGTSGEFNRFMKQLVTMMVMHGGVYIWPRDGSYLQLVPSREIVNTIRDQDTNKILYYRRKYKKYAYEKPCVTPIANGAAETCTELGDYIVDIPAEEIFPVVMFIDPDNASIFGGIEQLSTGFSQHTQSTKSLLNKALKDSTWGLYAHVPNMGEKEVNTLKTVFQNQLPTDSATGRRKISTGQILISPTELKEFSFSSNKNQQGANDEIEKQLLAAFGLSPSLLWSLNANLATALAQQNPTYRCMMEMQREVADAVKMAISSCLYRSEPGDFEVIMPDPVVASREKLAEMVSLLYGKGLMSKEESISILNFNDPKRAKKSLDLIKFEQGNPKKEDDSNEAHSVARLERKRVDLRKKYSNLPTSDI